MATIEIPFEAYVRGVRSSGPGVAVLMARLEKAKPVDITQLEKKAFKVVQVRAEQVAVVQSARDRLAPGRIRPVFLAFGSAWTAVYEALRAKARVPASISDVGQQADRMAGTLFPDAVSFAQLDAESAWSEGDRRLSRITDEGLEHDLVALVGSELLDTVKAATAALGDALGTIGDAHEAPSSSALQEALGLFGRAVGAYGRALAANCDEDDEASVQRFLKAVAPIDIHRANMRGGSDPTPDDGVDPASDPTSPPSTSPTGNGAPAPATPTSGSGNGVATT